MRFKIGDQLYETSALDEISIKDVVAFNITAERFGLTERWSDIERLSGETKGMTKAQALSSPTAPLLMGAMIWLARRTSSDPDIDFIDAIDFPLKNLEFLPEPEDKKPGKRKGGKSPSTRPSARASARGHQEPDELGSQIPTT